MSLEIRSVKGFETLSLRQKVLKPFASLEQCAYAEDDFTSTFHFGLFKSNALVGIATFIQEGHPDFSSTLPYRLRGMAVDREYQGQGFGQLLLGHGIEFLKKKNCDFMWFNAREVAFHFYEKMGFIQYGPLFELKNIGPHKVMYKNLIPS